MTSCAAAREALVDLVFTELDDDACARLNEHLSTCADCRLAERELLAMRDDVRGAAVAPTAALAERIRVALAVQAPARAPLWRRPVPAHVVLTASAACTVLTLLLATSRPHPTPSAPAAAGDTMTATIPAEQPAFSAAEPFVTGVRGTGGVFVRRDTLRGPGPRAGGRM